VRFIQPNWINIKPPHNYSQSSWKTSAGWSAGENKHIQISLSVNKCDMIDGVAAAKSKMTNATV